jgi:hypothetical protein
MDICPSRDDAQPHIFEGGRCALCLTPLPQNERWIARYGYSVGGTKHDFNWFWIRDEYTPNEKGNAERFNSAAAAKAAAREAVTNASAIQPHLQWRTAVERA